jgi:hypothetical protein
MSEQTQITEQTTPPVDATQATPTATPTPEAKTETTPVAQPKEQATVNKSWKDSISEQFRNDPNISKFTEIDALAKSYINATKMIGSDKIAVPNVNSTEEQWNTAYEALGRPNNPGEYKLESKSDVVPIDENAVKQFAENAHKLGLNNKQAQGILDFYKNNMESSAQQSKVDTETAQAQSEQELRKEWGKSYDTNIKKAGALAKANINANVLDMQLKDGTRLGDHPEVIKGFAKIANMMSEDSIVSTESENVNAGPDVESEISRITNDKDNPYWHKGHPDHDKMVQQVFTLREMLHSKK